MSFYNYTQLSNQGFEKLIIAICDDLLGAGTQSFTAGPDGGRDGVFVGRANKYPSNSAPWEGTIVIQAKHTEKINASYSDKDFYSPKNKNSYFHKELIKLETYLKNNKYNLTHYIIFSNRKLQPEKNDYLKRIISEKLGIPTENIGIIGISDLDRYLHDLPHIAKLYKLIPDVQQPFEFNPNDIALVICTMHKIFADKSKTGINTTITDFSRTRLSKKAPENNMSQDYTNALEEICMENIDFIKTFLANPTNSTILDRYKESAVALKTQVISYQKNSVDFDSIMEKIFEIIRNHPDVSNLCGMRNVLIKSILLNMFLDCDIGRNSNADTNKTNLS